MILRIFDARIALDVVVALAGLAIFVGAWIFLGITIEGTHTSMIHNLGLSTSSPEVRAAFVEAHHRFDAFRMCFAILGLTLTTLGCISFRANVRRKLGLGGGREALKSA